MVLILGIESSCDETACAVVKDGDEILSNVISSQIDLHQQYGGVVPELACRRHIDVIIPVVKQALRDAGVTMEQCDGIAVTQGPGLIGALLIGLTTAKALALSTGLPLFGVNHIEAHLYAAMMPVLQGVQFPALGLVISGGHTALFKIENLGSYELLGTTADDAVGEAFDKVASMLDLPYPGGPNIEALARSHSPGPFSFKAGKVKGRPLHFSFSGLKTNVLYTVKGQNKDKKAKAVIAPEDKGRVAHAFQEAALNDIVDKSKLAAEMYGLNTVFVGGGVANSRRLRALFTEKAPELNIHWPPVEMCMDNAAMIAGLGYQHYVREPKGGSLDLEAIPTAALATA